MAALRQFQLAPITAQGEPWVFGWDPQTGELSGPAAADIRLRIADGEVEIHPLPAVHVLGPDPLRSWVDMAAICGVSQRLDPELARHYPEFKDVENMPDGLVQ